jgi:hypothetical protein
MSVKPLILAAKLGKEASNQPHLLGLPVVVPYSLPFFLSFSPSLSVNSVGKGPSPTLVA